MAKTIGLSQCNKKILEFKPFPKHLPPAGLLYRQALDFYNVFRRSFGKGYIREAGHKIPNLGAFGPNLVLYHFALELLLKALVSLKGGIFDMDHNIGALLKKTVNDYPALSTILNNTEYMLLIAELSAWCIDIRYAQGSIALRHNNKKGWQKKEPLQELSEALHDIFNTLDQAFQTEVNKTKP